METHAYILAVDLGTSGPKVGLATTGGQMLGYEFEPVELLLYEGGGAEQAPGGLVAGHLLGFSPPAGPLSGGTRSPGCRELHGAMGRHGARRPGGPAAHERYHLARQPRRTVYQAPGGGWLSVAGYDPWKLMHWIRLFGTPPSLSGKDPFGHVLFIRHERPEIYRETYKFLEPLDFLNFRLTGRFAASYDSIGQYFATDNRRLDNVCYHEKLLAISTIRRSHLPDLLPPPACSAC